MIRAGRGTSLIQVLLFIAGLVGGILLRGRDGVAALLLAVGFGVQILGVALSVAEAFLLASAEIGSTELAYGYGLVLRLINLAAFVLIFVGLLRLVRRRPVASEGAARSAKDAARYPAPDSSCWASARGSAA